MSIGVTTLVTEDNAAVEASEEPKDLRKWINEALPWLTTLAVHVMVLVPLAWISSTIATETRPITIETRLPDDMAQPEFTQTMPALDLNRSISDSAFSLTKPGQSVGQQLGASFTAGTVAGPSFGSGRGTERQFAGIDNSRMAPTLAGPGGRGIPTGTKIDQRVSVRGSTEASGGAGGIGGAIDRITHEIARSLDDKKTLVIWLLDVTGSLKPQHEELFKRIDRVYEELGVVRKDKQRALLTAVVAFGEKDTPMMAEPTDDVDVVKKAIRAMKDDDSGTENTFTAATNALNRWGKYHTSDRRNILVIAVTDEKGDDEAKIEETIALAKNKYQAKVYVVGAYAPLGRPQVMLPWPSPSQVLGYAPADRGPESAMIERDSLPFWNSAGNNYDTLSSGFGPWALSRLCRETGGIFFIMEDKANQPFDPTALREYQPDYVPRKEYDRLLAAHPIRKAVVTAAAITSKGPQQIPRIPLQFPGDLAGLNNTMSQGQAAMAKIEYFVKEPLKELLAVKDQRDKDPSRRWRAEFDLMLGRLQANYVRVYTYNAICAQMKKKPKEFQDSKNNTWLLRPSADIPDDTPLGPKLVEAATKARYYLNRVVDENPGTPWAMLAKEELRTDLGFKWAETHVDIPKPGAMAKTKTKPAEPKKPATPAPPPPAVPKKI